MLTDEFIQFRKDFLTEAISLSDNKSVEYTISDEDRLRNFKHVAARLGITPQQALMVYVLKHVDAICNDAMTGKQYSDESFRSRALDICNYMILATALHKDLTHTRGNNDSNTEPDRSGSSSNSRAGETQSEPKEWNQLQRTK